MSGLQEETKGPLLGLPRVGVRAGQQPPISSLALGGFLAQGQLSGLTIAVPPSWSRQLDSSAWGLARPLPLPLSPRQGASCYDPLHPETPSDPPPQPRLLWVLGMGWWHKKWGARTSESPYLPFHCRGQ